MLKTCFKRKIGFFMTVLCFFSCINASAAYTLPNLGEPETASFTKGSEIELGEKAFNYVKKRLKLVEDKVVKDYVQELGERLLDVSDNPDGFKFNFYVTQDPVINAFAMPGGYVVLNTGFILATETESELASVVAHEITHVTQKHFARWIANSQRVQLAKMAGFIAAAVLSSYNPRVGSIAMATTMGNSTQNLINFTRKNEQEADSLGLDKLHRAGFDVHAMPQFLEKLKVNYQHENSKPPEYLLTHPLSENRVVKAKARAKKFPYRQVSSSIKYHLIKARLMQTKFKTAKEAVAFYQKKLEQGTYFSELETRYGLALSLERNNQLSASLAEIEKLSIKHQNNYVLNLDAARLEKKQGLNEKAKARLKNSIELSPHNDALIHSYCELLLENESKESANTVLKQINNNIKDKDATIVHKLKARSFAILDDKFNSYLSEADFLASKEHLYGSLHKLKQAKNLIDEGDKVKLGKVSEKIDLISDAIRKRYYS